MTISIGGGGNFNPDPQPLFQFVTTTQDEVGKKGSSPGVDSKVVMLPSSDSAGILFTQLDRDSKYKYNAQPGRPLLLPAGSFRSAGPSTGSDHTENWQNLFDQLASELPLDMQELIKEGRDQDALVLKEVLYDAVKMLDVQQRAFNKIESENVILRSTINANLPIEVFRNVSRIGKEFVETAKQTLEAFTPNDPEYLASRDLMENLEDLLTKANIPQEG